MSPHFSRRSLLSTATASVALSAHGSAKATDNADVIVIGAGLSGLHAAQILEDAAWTGF